MLDSNPIHHVNAFTWANPGEGPYGGHTGPPLVNIGGIWGTVCFDGFDQNAAEFFCRNLMTGGHLVEPISHSVVETSYGTYPVLLTNVQCIEHAASVADCTSGPMGYASCSSGKDIQLTCILGTPPTIPPTIPGN